jgi:S1-C subfamily serine protease
VKYDLYALLGVAPDANQATIAAACAQRLDLTTDHNTRVALRHAREVLCNPITRSAYDTKLRELAAPAKALPAPLLGDNSRTRLVAGVFAGAAFLVMLGWMNAKKPSPSVPAVAPVVQVEQPRPAAVKQAPTAPSTTAALAGPQSVYATAAPSVTLVLSADSNGQAFGSGSGVVIGAQRVITNCHVVQRAASVRVRYGDIEFAATSGTSDTYYDLCVLQVPNLMAPEVLRGSVKDVRVGQTVYAIGAPQGLDRTLSQGLISALRETADGTVIQTSAAISPGSSGGGLFDAEGRLIGITTFQAKAGQNLNFALPVDWLDRMQTR